MGKAISKKDINRLVENSFTFKKLLNDLEQDYRIWDRKQESEDLENITAQVIKIEGDIVQVMSDINSVSDHDEGIIIPGGIHYAFKIMNDLFGDIKKIREELESAYATPEAIHHIEVDWEKLRKTIDTLGCHFKTIELGQESFF